VPESKRMLRAASVFSQGFWPGWIVALIGRDDRPHVTARCSIIRRRTQPSSALGNAASESHARRHSSCHARSRLTGCG
jgi:hypothetical protein